MRIEEKNRIFNETVEAVKGFGYEVWTVASLFDSDFRYGYVTDGYRILYFQVNELKGLEWSTVCVPAKDTGSGCRIYVELTKESIETALSYSYGQSYKDFNNFKHRHWSELMRL